MCKTWGSRGKVGVISNRANNFSKPHRRKEEPGIFGEHKTALWVVCVWEGPGPHRKEVAILQPKLSVSVIPKLSFLLHTILILQTRPLTFGNVKHLVCINNWPTWARNLFIPFLKPISLSSVCTVPLPRPRNSDFTGNLLIVVELRRNQIERFYVLLFVWFLFLSLSKIHVAKVGRNLPTSFALLLNGFSRLKSPSAR